MIRFVTLKELSGCVVATRVGTGKMKENVTDTRTVVDRVCVGPAGGRLGERSTDWKWHEELSRVVAMFSISTEDLVTWGSTLIQTP